MIPESPQFQFRLLHFRTRHFARLTKRIRTSDPLVPKFWESAKSILINEC